MLGNIKKRCKERGISISELEKACGIGVNSIHKWDRHIPSVEKVKNVADFFGCTVDELLREDSSLQSE